jgi:hypothetical protein
MTSDLSSEAWRIYMKLINTERMLDFSMERSIRLRRVSSRAYDRYKRRRDVFTLESLRCSIEGERVHKLVRRTSVSNILIAAIILIFQRCKDRALMAG